MFIANAKGHDKYMILQHLRDAISENISDFT